MVKAKCLYDPVDVSDGERLLVTRYWPRGVSKKQLSAQWLKNLAPSEKLVSDWKKKKRKISWEEYTLRHHEEMRGQREPIKKLAQRAKRGTITLLCYERD
jgi:uncharacterized protein YeaO (DUF488 family)